MPVVLARTCVAIVAKSMCHVVRMIGKPAHSISSLLPWGRAAEVRTEAQCVEKPLVVQNRSAAGGYPSTTFSIVS